MSSLHADEAFLAHYQFSHDPFAPRVPGFKFFPAQRKPVLGQLHHLARYSNLLLAVTGPLGSGKTLLRQALVASTNKDAVCSLVISGRSVTDELSLLRQLAQGLGTTQVSIDGILLRAAQLAVTGQDVYLLVDDAEQLQTDALDGLLQLADGDAEARLHVFLFGEPSLLTHLDELSQDEERFHAIELQPYNLEETSEYLAQRLEGAGQGIELISADLLADIHEQSGGWPGAINQVTRDVLVEAMLAERAGTKTSGTGFKLPKKHLAILGVVAVGVLAAWFMQGKTSPQSGPTQAVQPQGAPASQASAPAVEFANSTQPLPLPLEPQPVVREPMAQAGGQQEPDEGTEPVAPQVDAPVSANSGTRLPLNPVPAEPQQPVSAVQQGAGQASPQAPTPEVAQVKPASNSTPEPRVTQTHQPSTKSTTASKATTASKPVSKSTSQPVTKPVSKAVVSPGGDWYRSQAGSRYAVQVLGTASEASAKAFIQQQGADYRYFRKTLQGKAFYVVTYGSFPDRSAAQGAIKRLPANVQAAKPWVRTFSSIQQDMTR